MAPWYELVFASNLRDDTPSPVIDVLNYLIASPFNEETRQPEPIALPNHPFFTMYEWYALFGMDCYYFPGDTFGSLNLDEYANFYRFTARAKHRDSYLIGSFLHWFAPYSQTQGFVGYTRCDEDGEIDLIYFENDSIYYKSIDYDTDPPRLTKTKINADGEESTESFP